MNPHQDGSLDDPDSQWFQSFVNEIELLSNSRADSDAASDQDTASGDNTSSGFSQPHSDGTGPTSVCDYPYEHKDRHALINNEIQQAVNSLASQSFPPQSEPSRQQDLAWIGNRFDGQFAESSFTEYQIAHEANTQGGVPSFSNTDPQASHPQLNAVPDSLGDLSQLFDTRVDLGFVADGLRRELLAQNLTEERFAQIQQFQHDLRNALIDHRSASQGEPIPGQTQPANRKINKSKLYYRCRERGCNTEVQIKSTFKRHLEDKHYPRVGYCCPWEGCGTREPFHRRDKIADHYRYHGVLSLDQLPPTVVPYPCPPVCKFCPLLTGTWEAFYRCVIRHCEIRPPSPNAGSCNPKGVGRGQRRRRDGPGSDQSGRGAGTTSSKKAAGRSGSATGQTHQQHPNSSGVSSNRMHNSDLKPSSRECSASDRTLSAQNDQKNVKSHPRPLGSDLDQRGQPSQGQEPSRPQFAPRNSQGQDAPQPSVRQCRYCNHILDLISCTACRRSDPLTPWCHNCTPAQQDQAMQGIAFQNRALGSSYASGQAMRLTGAQSNLQISFGARMGPMMAPPNRNLFRQIAHRPPQPNQLSIQQLHVRGAHSNTQRNLFGASGSYTVRAVHDALTHGMSELEIEASIFESKSKLDSKSQSSSVWSIVLPFRGSPPTRKPLIGTTTRPADGIEAVAQQFIGPPTLTKANPSSGCQCNCRIRSEGSYFARSRVDIAPGRRIEVDFKMAPEARGTSHALRTRVQVVVKMLRLRSSVARSANGKHKTEAHAAIKDALEATLDGTETKTTTSHDQAKDANLDNLEYDSDVESVTDTTFSANSRASSYTDLTQFSPPSSPPPWDDSKSSFCTDLELPPSANSSSPFYLDWDVDTLCSEEQPDHDTELFEEEEKELELTFDLDLHSSLNRLARCTNVPAEDLCSDQTPDLLAWDSDRVAEYLTKYLLFVMFSLARSRDNNLNPCYEKPPSKS